MFVSAVLRWPFCLAESLRLERRLARLTLDPAPVFIIGHWRSGTTFLHNLMSRDKAFCFPTIADALRPYDFFPSPFEPISRAILMRALPARRPMDDLPLQPSLPQEDEIAMATMGAPSLFNCFYFPAAIGRTFAREVLFEGIAEHDLERWRASLRGYLAKLALLHPGRRLLLKNPAHSARVRELKALFPGAKFIHLHRDPIQVLASTRKLYRAMLPLLALQKYEPAEVERHVVSSYQRMMDRLFLEIGALSADELAAVPFAELVRDPVATIAQLYEHLDLGDFAPVRTELVAYAHRQARAPQSPDPSDLAFCARHAASLAPYRQRLGYERD